MSFQVMYVTIITKAPKREKAEVMVIKVRFKAVFPIGPKPSVVGCSFCDGVEVAMTFVLYWKVFSFCLRLTVSVHVIY